MINRVFCSDIAHIKITFRKIDEKGFELLEVQLRDQIDVVREAVFSVCEAGM
jgi:hypothetical protein